MKKTIIILNMLLFILILIFSQSANMNTNIQLDKIFLSFSGEHIFGTDNLGRDVFSLILAGGLRTIEVLIISSSVSFIFGTFLGLISGYFENFIGTAIKSLIDLFMIVPSLVSAMIITAIFGISPLTAGLSLGIFGMGNYLNQTDSLTKREKKKEYIQASMILGVPWYVILYRRILVNILPELYVNFGNTAVASIIQYASLTFIGLGSDFTKPDWGAMLYEYRIYFISKPSLILIPSFCIFWISLSINIFFENIKD